MRSSTSQVLILIALCGWLAAGAAAQAPGAYTGIDLVVVIDQSGSMWGHPRYHPEKNDQWEHRIGATQEVIDRLLADVWKRPVVHRFSVVDFADDAKVSWSDQVLRYDPKDPEALGRAVRSLLSTRVQAKTGDAWVNTNTPLALETARRELVKMGAGEPRSGRRKIVLLITDGRANQPPATLATMQSRVSDAAGALAKDGTELWVLGLNDADPYWHEGDGAFWEGLAGHDRARLAEEASTRLPTVVRDMVDAWLGVKPPGPPPPPINDSYLCPPYLGRLTFRVGLGTPHAEVRILDPAGQEVPRTAGGPLSVPGTYDHFTRDDPPPGLYRVEKRTDRSYSVDVGETAPRIERLIPAAAADLGVEGPIVFQVKTLAGKPLELLPKWPLRATVRLTSPAGKVTELPAAAGAGGRFEARWKPEAPGIYQVELRGMVHLEDGSEHDVFQSPPDAYPRRLEVGNGRSFGLRFEAPRPASGLRVAPWAKSARVELSLVDGKGERVEKPSALVKDPASWLALQVIDSSGVALSPPLPLAPAAGGSFQGQVPVDPSWRRASGLFRQGKLHLRVLAQPGHLAGDSRLGSIQLPPEAQDLRVGGDPMTVGPIDLLFPIWLIVIALAPILGLAGWLGWLAISRILPGLMIKRQDAERNRNVHLKIFDMSTDPSAASGLALEIGSAVQSKLDDRVSFPVGGEKVVAEKFKVTRLPSNLKARARLDYRWKGKRQIHSATLTSGSFKTLNDLPPETGRTVVMLTDSK